MSCMKGSKVGLDFGTVCFSQDVDAIVILPVITFCKVFKIFSYLR